MKQLNSREISLLVTNYIGISAGYLGDFSYSSHASFYPDYCQIYDITPEEFPGTTRERFMEILRSQSAARQAAILRGVLERFPANNQARVDFQPTVESWISLLEAKNHVKVPHISSTSSSIVELALRDAEILIQTSGPVSAVDRMHTALHGLLKSICANSGVSLSQEATLNNALKKARECDPRLNPSGPRSNEISRIIQSMATTMDALTTIRNNASPAHPNSTLLGEDEATLAVNATRTLFVYISSKIM